MCGPGSKALLFGLLLGLHGVDVAIPRPSWVSYAAQAALTGVRPVHVPIADGAGGVPDPDLLSGAVTTARRAGRRIGAVIVTLPDNPTGTLAGPDSVRQLCAVAERHDLLIISDEIYRDLTHAAAAPFLSPAEVAPERTVITAGLSKNLALGGWRLGVARLPGGAHRLRAVRDRLMGACSEIWSAPAAPVQAAAAVAFSEPPAVTERIARSRRLHGAVARAVASLLTEAGVAVRRPQARSTCTRTSARTAGRCGGAASPRPRSWRRCCCAITASGRCLAASSATRRRRCGCGSRRRGCTGRPPGSRRRRSPPTTRSRCRGSPTPWTGSGRH